MGNKSEILETLQELWPIFKTHWYFIFVYIWWIWCSFFYFKEKKEQERIKEKLDFNWLAYLITIAVLYWLYIQNQTVFDAFFQTVLKIIVLPVFAVLDFATGVKWFIESATKEWLGSSDVPVIVQILLVPALIIVFIISLIFLLIGLFITLVLWVVVWLLGDLYNKWFGNWFERNIFTKLDLKFQYSIPLISLIFYPAVSTSFNFIYESLTRHPLEGVVTVRVSRKFWLLAIGILIMTTGFLGKYHDEISLYWQTIRK